MPSGKGWSIAGRWKQHLRYQCISSSSYGRTLGHGNAYWFIKEGLARYFRIMDKTVIIVILRGMWWCSWLRHYCTSWKAMGSIPDGVIGFFCNQLNHSGCPVGLGSTGLLKEMSIRAVSWGGKGRQWVGLMTLPPLCANCLENLEPQLPRALTACPGLCRDCYTSVVIFAWCCTWIQDILLHSASMKNHLTSDWEQSARFPTPWHCVETTRNLY